MEQVTTEIDYKAEVLKVYPDAFIHFDETVGAGSVNAYWFNTAFGRMPQRICRIYSKEHLTTAWQSAYETLKQQGKL